ncbi:MAG: acyl--CoA ligase [Erysipelotrichaceae bacterium]|nr:acyl--CoA ligase [Erysipelotrichaceae bacterium]
MYQLISEAAKKVPNNTAIYYQKRKISFKKFLSLIDNTADILEHRLGVHKGDTILVSLPNIPNVLILIYAINKLGAISSLVHPFTPYNQLKLILDKTRCKWAFVFEQRVAKELDKFKAISDICYVSRVEDFLPFTSKLFYHTFMNFKIRKKLSRTFKFKGFHYYHKLKGTHSGVTSYLNNGKDCALLLQSGSTTGDPKTISISNNNMNFIASKAAELMCLPEEELLGKGMLSFLPSFHGFGIGMTMHAPLATGWASVLIPKFSADAVVDAMKHTPVNAMCGVPTAYENLINSEVFTSSNKLRGLHVCWSGGDSMPPALQVKWNKIMERKGSHCHLFEGYGLTECVAAIVVNTYEHNKIGTLGYPVVGADVKIYNDKSKEVKNNEIGEIAIKSPANMMGYFSDPTATDNALRNGYVFTGDLGYKDDDGFIHFASRKKRVVKVSGVGVFPSEIEKLVSTIPGIKDVCAIQIPDEKLQAAIKLFVVTDVIDKESMKEDIINRCQRYLIRWAVPKEIEYRDFLPKTPLNKTDFKKLQEEENKKRGLKD